VARLVKELVLFFYILIGWLMIALFAILPRKLPVTDNLVVFFCSSIFLTSVYTLTNINWGLIHPSQQLILYFSLWVSHWIIFPVTLLNFANIFFCSRLALQRWGTAVLVFVLLNAVEFLSQKLKLETYHHWNPFYSLIMFALFMVVPFLVEKGFRKFSEKEAA
jgi:hypothetical protein